MINIISDEEIFIIYFVQGQLVKFCIGVGVTLTKSKVKKKRKKKHGQVPIPYFSFKIKNLC